MDVLLHLGLNKCASTFIQHALDTARPGLSAAGVCYPAERGQTAHYGLSRAYGFGPEASHVRPARVAELVSAARREGAERLILSSEYLSLHRPDGAARLMADLEAAGCRTRLLLFSRPVVPWIRSLFNQYVRTVDDGRPLANIDAFVDQVLANGAVDIRRRHDLWAGLAGAGGLAHYRISPEATDGDVLAPFEAFTGVRIPAPTEISANASVSADSLYRIGQLRALSPGRRRDREIAALIGGAPSPVAAPPGYAEIGEERMARLRERVVLPYESLPFRDLAVSSPSLASPGAQEAA